MPASNENLKKWDDAFKKPDALAKILKVNKLKNFGKIVKGSIAMSDDDIDESAIHLNPGGVRNG